MDCRGQVSFAKKFGGRRTPVSNFFGEVKRLIGLGATRKEWMYPPEADYVVLQDPDGNPFCVVQR
ncbi:MAG TPA: hypothetical protein IAA38_02005 [Candidatus Ruminococcus gallistercoris]|nr:hypothetical protein [Candidatus Ruminococcus gallistercoris]